MQKMSINLKIILIRIKWKYPKVYENIKKNHMIEISKWLKSQNAKYSQHAKSAEKITTGGHPNST